MVDALGIATAMRIMRGAAIDVAPFRRVTFEGIRLPAPQPTSTFRPKNKGSGEGAARAKKREQAKALHVANLYKDTPR